MKRSIFFKTAIASLAVFFGFKKAKPLFGAAHTKPLPHDFWEPKPHVTEPQLVRPFEFDHIV